MQTLKYFLLICFTAQLINAQSSIVIGAGASIDVALMQIFVPTSSPEQ